MPTSVADMRHHYSAIRIRSVSIVINLDGSPFHNLDFYVPLGAAENICRADLLGTTEQPGLRDGLHDMDLGAERYRSAATCAPPPGPVGIQLRQLPCSWSSQEAHSATPAQLTGLAECAMLRGIAYERAGQRAALRRRASHRTGAEGRAVR
jgi:hypothetical protein